MAQLPPRTPSMTQNWPSFPHQMLPIPMGKDVISPHHQSWVDEFLDFSSAKRNSHRRSASDSIAFLPLLEDCSSPHSAAGGENENSGGFDDEQIMSMFADDLPSNSSENRKAEVVPRVQQPKPEPQEVDCLDKCDGDDEPPVKVEAGGGETIRDPKRVKRILANRQSAQRSRVRKLQYISELERSVTTLQTEVSTLSPRVAFLDHQRLILNVDNSALKQRIAALIQDKIFKDAHQEALKKEIERLRHVYHEQKMGSAIAPPVPLPNSDDIGDCSDDNAKLNR